MNRITGHIEKLLIPMVFGVITVFSAPSDALFDPLEFHTGIQLRSLERQSRINPCWRILDDSVTSVRYSFQSGSVNGDFRRRLDPAAISDNYWTVQGSKQLGERSLFSGSFSYRFKNDRDRMWAHNRRAYSGLPYVFADSSVGDWELNGLMWQVDVSRELIQDRMYGGLSISYNVDEEYQDIFPRPKANHRDILINAGLGAVTVGQSRVGLMVKYYNIQESLRTSKYSLDQEKTPIFYKLRGLDTPLIFRGQTSEERLYSIEGLALQADGIIRKTGLFTIDYSAKLGRSFAENVDGGAYPIEQGDWEDAYAGYTLQLSIYPEHIHNIILFSGGSLRDQDATHPDHDLNIYTEKDRKIWAGATLQMRTPGGWSLAPTFTMYSNYLKREDTFNGILDYFPGSMQKYSIALDMPDWKRVDYSLSFGFDRYRAGDTKVYVPANVGFWYQNITVIDEWYYGSDHTAFRMSETVSFGQKRRYSLVLEYVRLVPESTDIFDYREQLHVTFVVEDLIRPKP